MTGLITKPSGQDNGLQGCNQLLMQQDEEAKSSRNCATLTVFLKRCWTKKRIWRNKTHEILLYRSFGDLDKDIKKHELVAVETGKNIDDVADALIKAAADDLAGMPEYEHCETAAYAPEPVKDFRKVRRYQYEMTGIVYPPNADKNILIDYGIVEAEE